MKQSPIYFFVVIFTFTFFLGYTFSNYQNKDKYVNFAKSFKTIRENSSRFEFINPLIGNASLPATEVGLYLDVKLKINNFFIEEKKKGNLYEYSLYFRDLNTGFWFGINEDISFFPASLFKLPVAIAAFKQEEVEGNFLNRKYLYTKKVYNKNQNITANSESLLIVGKYYSGEELIRMMLENSDNGAKDLLLQNMKIEYINKLFELVSASASEELNLNTVSSKMYSLFFRLLYGSSYINEEHSEFVMSLLTKSDFKEGLVAGIPNYLKIAHKYGVYSFNEDINGKLIETQQLHDCGIIYEKESPYLLCLMTKGNDSQKLFNIISKVSNIIYENAKTFNK